MPDRSKTLANSLPTASTRHTEDFKKLQDIWYRKALATGLDAPEIHEDKDGHLVGELTNGYLPAGKRKDDVSLDAEFGLGAAEEENLTTFGQPTTVWETPKAAYWRFYSQEVESLPEGYPRRAFLVAWVENGGDVVNAAKETGVSRWHGREAVRKLHLRLRKLGRIR